MTAPTGACPATPHPAAHALAQLLAKAQQLILGERLEHARERRYREAAQKPGDDRGVDARVLAQRKREVALGGKAGAVATLTRPG